MTARLALAAGVASIHIDDVSYAAVVPDGPIVVLDGIAAVIWELLRMDGDADTLRTRVADRLIDPPDDLDAAIANFVMSLHEQGLLATEH
ncbi:PqqD family peptide modification chaperone [Microbacterium terrisoli]|jgi:hypothetical protein|uniref:PqqD family peptide modification chaperone n=1 Tax=Microbacterium terrisoli TaxID=3242192 RepID=UPI002805F4F7|nr:PqqD family peptide modification chaperone [Microbacterium protaetiae]